MWTTPDLSKSFNPVPKPLRKVSLPKPMNKIGKKTVANMEATAELKKTAIQLGITKCEVKLNDCWKDIHGFAHGKKKRKLTADELKKFAIASCNNCHQKIEYECQKWTGMAMEQFVRQVIADRKIKLWNQ